MSTSNKLTYLNGTKQLLKDKINNLGGSIDDNTTFRQYANQLQNVYDNLPKTSYQEGTEINLGKTIKGKLDFEEDNGKKVVGIGQSSQDSTTGKNLFNINSTPVVVQTVSYEVKNFKLIQENSGSYARTQWLVTGLTVGETYTFSCNFLNPNASSIQTRIYDSTNTSAINKNSTLTTDTSGTQTITFNALETSHYIRIYSNTLNASDTNTVTYSDIQVEKGSSVTSWEKYTGRTSLT